MHFVHTFFLILAVLFCRFGHLAALPVGSKNVTETGKRHKIFFFLSNVRGRGDPLTSGPHGSVSRDVRQVSRPSQLVGASLAVCTCSSAPLCPSRTLRSAARPSYSPFLPSASPVGRRSVPVVGGSRGVGAVTCRGGHAVCHWRAAGRRCARRDGKVASGRHEYFRRLCATVVDARTRKSDRLGTDGGRCHCCAAAADPRTMCCGDGKVARRQLRRREPTPCAATPPRSAPAVRRRSPTSLSPPPLPPPSSFRPPRTRAPFVGCPDGTAQPGRWRWRRRPAVVPFRTAEAPYSAAVDRFSPLSRSDGASFAVHQPTRQAFDAGPTPGGPRAVKAMRTDAAAAPRRCPEPPRRRRPELGWRRSPAAATVLVSCPAAARPRHP